jgi:hypothetical protein
VKKFLAGLLIALFSLMVIGFPRNTQMHPPKDSADAIGQLAALVLLIAGVFYSVRWYMKLSGHTYKLARQAWASILFCYSLLGILIGLAMLPVFMPGRTVPVAFGIVMVAVWTSVAVASWMWRRRLRRAETSGAVSK